MERRNKAGQFTSAATAMVRDRFEAKFVMIPHGGCWLWTGANKNDFGHGAFKMGNRLSKVRFAHRVAWELYVGDIPSGQCVLHRCDNPACVNPHHLFLGTSMDNMIDMVRKGRQAKGVACPSAKINDEIALDIKRMLGLSTSAIGTMFNISRQAVADIRYGRTWKHVQIQCS